MGPMVDMPRVKLEICQEWMKSIFNGSDNPYMGHMVEFYAFGVEDFNHPETSNLNSNVVICYGLNKWDTLETFLDI